MSSTLCELAGRSEVASAVSHTAALLAKQASTWPWHFFFNPRHPWSGHPDSTCPWWSQVCLLTLLHYSPLQSLFVIYFFLLLPPSVGNIHHLRHFQDLTSLSSKSSSCIRILSIPPLVVIIPHTWTLTFHHWLEIFRSTFTYTQSPGWTNSYASACGSRLLTCI